MKVAGKLSAEDIHNAIVAARTSNGQVSRSWSVQRLWHLLSVLAYDAEDIPNLEHQGVSLSDLAKAFSKKSTFGRAKRSRSPEGQISMELARLRDVPQLKGIISQYVHTVPLSKGIVERKGEYWYLDPEVREAILSGEMLSMDYHMDKAIPGGSRFSPQKGSSVKVKQFLKGLITTSGAANARPITLKAVTKAVNDHIEDPEQRFDEPAVRKLMVKATGWVEYKGHDTWVIKRKAHKELSERKL